jgi:hypothetical protein
MKTKKTTKAKAAGAPKKDRNCRAPWIGHKSCNCGGPYCGANVNDPHAE